MMEQISTSDKESEALISKIWQWFTKTPAPTALPNYAATLLVIISISFAVIFLLLPVVVIFIESFKAGFDVYTASIFHREAKEAIKLSLLVVSISVPLNLIFGVYAAWCITKFDFPGKAILTALIDLPFSVSPVISGLLYVLLFGMDGLFGSILAKYNIKILFAVPGLVLVTVFVTFPFVAKELIPLMQEQGRDEEEVALTLGASGWQTFFYVTLPNIKWALLYGVLLCNARAMGEFGAVSVVSGHIRGQTNTIPLHVEILYNEYNFAAAFAVASVLTLLALITLVIKSFFEWKCKDK
jgi:sulfate transport system permease protein